MQPLSIAHITSLVQFQERIYVQVGFLLINNLMSGIPFGIWLAFSWSLGIHGLWIGLTVSLVYCAVIGTYICVSTNWEKEVTKVTARLAKEDKDNERDRQASISAA